VDALGWKRVLGGRHQPPEAPLSRGLERHPAHDGSGDELHCWIDRGLVRRGYGWHVPAGGEARIGVGSYDPRKHVKEPTIRLAPEGRFQGNWFPHRLRPAADGRTFFAGDSAGHCFPLSGEGIRTAFYFGIAAAREITAALEGSKSRDDALRDYAAFSASHARAFALGLRLQRLIPALPPRVLTLGLRAFQPFVNRAFSRYLAVADPGMVASWDRTLTRSRPPTRPSAKAI
jgi:flavin-dependent dehydrogenase